MKKSNLVKTTILGLGLALAPELASTSTLETKLTPLQTAQRDTKRTEIPSVYWDLSDLTGYHTSDMIQAMNQDLENEHNTRNIGYKRNTELEDFLAQIPDIRKLYQNRPNIKYFITDKGKGESYVYRATALEALHFDTFDPNCPNLTFPPPSFFKEKYEEIKDPKAKSKFLDKYDFYTQELASLISELGFNNYSMDPTSFGNQEELYQTWVRNFEDKGIRIINP